MAAADGGTWPRSWLRLGAGAVLLGLAAFVWFGPVNFLGGVTAGWVLRLAALIGLAGAVCVALGVHRVRVASHGSGADEDKTADFTRGAGLVLSGLSLWAVAVWLSWPHVGAPSLERMIDSDWFRGSFEIAIAAVVVIAIGGCDWFARAWLSAGDKAKRAERREPVDLFSMTLACALGVLTLVAIGSAVFSARLVQIDFARLTSTLETVMPIDRVVASSNQHTGLTAEIEQADRAFVAASQAWYAFDDAAVQAALTGDEAAAQAAAARRDSQEQRANQLIRDMARLGRERFCTERALAVQIYNQRARTPNESMWTPPPGGDLCDHDQFTDADLQKAATLIGAVNPLQRSWMSAQLVRRAPILLSIELVLVMGALGALVRAATPYLLMFLQRLDEQRNVRLQTHQAGKQKYLMLTLGLHVVFGMSTAFIFFLLLKTGIAAAELQAPGTSAADTDLNPFTASVLGLIGGYASLNVVEWLGVIAGDLTRRPRSDQGRGDTA